MHSVIVFSGVCNRYKTSKLTKDKRGRSVRGVWVGCGRGVEELEKGYQKVLSWYQA